MTNNASSGVGIAVTQWNHAHLTQPLLSSLISTNCIRHIALCDNGSSKTEYRKIADYLERALSPAKSDTQAYLTLLRNKNNSGFSIGSNLAISELLKRNVEWIWLLNNDVKISEQHLRQTVDKLKQQKPGVYGISVHETGIGKFTGCYSYNHFSARHKPIVKQHQLSQHSQSNRYVSGASMIVHRSVFEASGLLCDKTFLYYEELDFIHKARANGFEQHFIEGPELHHLGAGSSDDSSLNHVRIYNETWSLLNYYHNHKRYYIPWIFAARMPLRLMSLTLSGRLKLVPQLFFAIADYYQSKNRFIKPTEVVDIKLFDHQGID